MLKKVTNPMSAFSPNHVYPRSYNVRSISFPPRSHPAMHTLQEELNKLTTSASTASIAAHLSCLGEIYSCIGDLLDLPITQQALPQHHSCRNDKLLDNLVTYLDICGNTRDAILLFKQTVRELQSALRRTKATTTGIDTHVNAYISARKAMKKNVTKSLTSLKQPSEKYMSEQQYHLADVIRLLQESSLLTSSILTSLLTFLSAPVLLKPIKASRSRWGLVMVSKLVHKGVVACEGRQQEVGLLGNVDSALSNVLLVHDKELLEPWKIQSAQEKLEVLDVCIEEIENEVECLFRRLIKTGGSLLNIYTFFSLIRVFLLSFFVRKIYVNPHFRGYA